MIKLRGGVWWSDFRRPDGTRVRKSLGTTDKKEAQQLEAKLMTQVDAVKPVKVAAKSLKDVFDGAMREHERWRSAKSPKTLKDNWKYVTSYFDENRDIYSITTKDIVAYAMQMSEAGLSASTINQRMSLLSVLFNQMEVWGYEIQRPKITRRKVSKGRQRRITPQEEAQIHKEFSAGIRPRHADMSDLIVVLIDTGMRLSEALRIRDMDIDRQQRTVTIWENKADHPRAVPMTARVFEVFERKSELATPFGSLTVDAADHEWAWVRTRMGLDADKEFVIHALRHSTASRLADAGVDAFRIQKMMGHKNIATTMKYVHVSAAGLHGLAGVLETASLVTP